MADFHDTDYQIRLKQGVHASINALATRNSAVTSEPHFTTDTHRLFIFTGSINERVHGLDLLMFGEDFTMLVGEDFSPLISEALIGG